MSETKKLKLLKHDNPSTNQEEFDIENYLNGNWDKVDDASVPAGGKTGQVLTKTSDNDFDATWEEPGGGDVSYIEDGKAKIVIEEDDFEGIDGKEDIQVIDNLESLSTIAALSANQGRLLKNILDEHFYGFQDTQASDIKELLREKLQFGKSLCTKDDEIICFGGGWKNNNYGFSIFSKKGQECYDVIFITNTIIYMCRQIGGQYTYSKIDAVTF